MTKFQRYRQQRLRRGMKQLGRRVPDPDNPEFAAEAMRQGTALRGRPEETETLNFIQVAVD